MSRRRPGWPGRSGETAPSLGIGGFDAATALREATITVSQDDPGRLLGRWRLLRADANLDFAPNARMEFLTGGRLRYAFDAGDHRQVVMLVYRVDGDMLLTDNPASPHARSTRFRFGAGDSLVLEFAEATAWFVREL
jgi:hypothetical protein